MSTQNLTNEQVVDLIKKLPKKQQAEVLQILLQQQWETWQSLSEYGAEKVRTVAFIARS